MRVLKLKSLPLHDRGVDVDYRLWTGRTSDWSMTGDLNEADGVVGVRSSSIADDRFQTCCIGSPASRFPFHMAEITPMHLVGGEFGFKDRLRPTFEWH